MASAPSASWNSRCITHLANCPNRSLPTNSSDESFLKTGGQDLLRGLVLGTGHGALRLKPARRSPLTARTGRSMVPGNQRAGLHDYSGFLKLVLKLFGGGINKTR